VIFFLCKKVRTALKLRLFLVAVVSLWALPETAGKFAELKTKGVALLEKGRYNEAINSLEEVWEHDQSDPVVAEYLAMGHLYSDQDAQGYLRFAEVSLKLGGAASFLVQHPHEKVPLLSGDLADYCNGRLSIYSDRLVFTSNGNSQHSFTIPRGSLKEIKENRAYGSKRGMYHVRTSDKKNYNFRPRSSSEEERRLILSLTEKYIK